MSLLDLTHPIRDGLPGYPGDPPVEVAPAATMDDDGYRLTELACHSHVGTHLDAPSHTEPDGPSLDDYPVGRFAFDARLVDVSEKAPRESIAVDDLPKPDRSAGTDSNGGADGDLLVFRTGCDAHWGTDRYLDHPFLSPAAAERCAAAGWSVAMDALSPDPTPAAHSQGEEPGTETFPAHRAILGADLFVVENLTNLDAIAALDAPQRDRFTFYAFPLALADADGAPIRAVADVS